MRFIPLASVVLGSWLALPVAAADAQAWLKRLASAEHTQSFQGHFVYERNGSLSTHRIWHQVSADGVVHERLVQLDGPVQEVVRTGGQVQCASSAFADQAPDTQVWPARPLNALQLGDSYDARVVGVSRVAGRETTVLGLIPRDQHRYAVELHLDQATALPLKSLLLNDEGQLLERFQFSDLQVGAASDADLQASDACKPVAVVQARASVADAWRADWLPPGFVLKGVTVRPSSTSDESVASLVYGDGLASFSVFLEPLVGEAVEDARSQLGPTVAVSRRLATVEGDVMVTVVGEVPLGTAERVALSIRSAVGETSAPQ